MSSIPDAIPKKSLPKSEVLERIFIQDFYLKIIFPSNIRLNSDDQTSTDACSALFYLSVHWESEMLYLVAAIPVLFDE